MSHDILQEFREKIEKTDQEIVRLLNERAAVSVEIGKTKRTAGREVYDPSREAMVYRHLETLNEGILSGAALRGIFREILSSSRFLQTPTTVAYLGPEASFTHQAALAHFGGGIAAIPTVTIPEVFDEVERGKEQWGIVPVENSAEGSVKTTLDRLISTPLTIRGRSTFGSGIASWRAATTRMRSARSTPIPRPSPSARCGSGPTSPAFPSSRWKAQRERPVASRRITCGRRRERTCR